MDRTRLVPVVIFVLFLILLILFNLYLEYWWTWDKRFYSLEEGWIRWERIKHFHKRLRFIRIMTLIMAGLAATISIYQYSRSKSPEEPKWEINLPSPPVALNDWLNSEIERMDASGKGVLLHNIPAEMTVEDKETIEVRVAKKLSLELTQRLAGNGDPEISQVKVQSTMGAILTGTKNYFEIDLKNTEEKTIQADTFAQWIYEVTPEEAGTPDLYLTLYLVLDTPEGKYKYESPAIKKTVIVHSNPVATGTSFLSKHWMELTGLLVALGAVGALIRLVGWLATRRSKDKSNFTSLE